MSKYCPQTRPRLTGICPSGLYGVFALAFNSNAQAMATRPDHDIGQLQDTAWSFQHGTRSDAWLDIVPGFFQTHLFSWLCIVAAALMLWILHQLRLTQALRRMRNLYQKRLVERERVAREINDGLLQGVQGLIFEFRGALFRLDESPGRRQLCDALDKANRMLIEGRNRVQGLGTNGDTGGSLTDALADLARGLAKDHPCAIRITSEGAPRGLNPEVQEQVRRIVGEALLNTLNHAAATDVELNIIVCRKHLQLHLRDNGIGIPKDVMKAGKKPGRWGLPGMRERANSIRGRFAVHSQPGIGTELDLVVPAGVAFTGPGRPAPWLRFLYHFNMMRSPWP